MKTTKTLATRFLIASFFALAAVTYAQADAVNEIVPSAKAQAAAHAYDYNEAHLHAFGNGEGGADVLPSAKALAAAHYYVYDQDKLAEAGDENYNYYVSQHQSKEVRTAVNHAGSDSSEMTCKTC